jgi:hypothetical protein
LKAVPAEDKTLQPSNPIKCGRAMPVPQSTLRCVSSSPRALERIEYSYERPLWPAP